MGRTDQISSRASVRLTNADTFQRVHSSTLQEARDLVAGRGQYERDTAFEPLLVPLVAGHVACEEIWFTCYVGSLASRPSPRLGWPLLGVSVASQVAPLVASDHACDAVQTLPDLALFLPDELLRLIALRPADERIRRRLDVHRGERPLVDVRRVVNQSSDATALVLHLEHSDLDERERDTSRVLASTAGDDRMRRLLYLALIAPYAHDPGEVASSALGLLDGDVPGWYWCTMGAHLDVAGHDDLRWLMSAGRIASPWAEHYDRLINEPRRLDPLELPAAAHPYGSDLVALLAQMPRDERESLAREVLNGVVDHWAIDITRDHVPALFPTPSKGWQGRGSVARLDRAPTRVQIAEPETHELDVLVPALEHANPTTSPSLPPPVLAHPAEVVAGRALRVDVTIRGTDAGPPTVVTKSFLQGSDHELLVWIGNDATARDTTLTASVGLDVPATDLGNDVTLTVVLVHDDDRLTREIILPANPSADGTPVRFSLFVRSDERHVLATIVVVRRGRIVQQAVLTGETGPRPDSVEDGVIELRVR